MVCLIVVPPRTRYELFILRSYSYTFSAIFSLITASSFAKKRMQDLFSSNSLLFFCVLFFALFHYLLLFFHFNSRLRHHTHQLRHLSQISSNSRKPSINCIILTIRFFTLLVGVLNALQHQELRDFLVLNQILGLLAVALFLGSKPGGPLLSQFRS